MPLFKASEEHLFLKIGEPLKVLPEGYDSSLKGATK